MFKNRFRVQGFKDKDLKASSISLIGLIGSIGSVIKLI